MEYNSHTMGKDVKNRAVPYDREWPVPPPKVSEAILSFSDQEQAYLSVIDTDIKQISDALACNELHFVNQVNAQLQLRLPPETSENEKEAVVAFIQKHEEPVKALRPPDKREEGYFTDYLLRLIQYKLGLDQALMRPRLPISSIFS